MPELMPFRGWRYAPALDLLSVTAPPYDVLSDAEVAAYAARDARNIVHVDVPPHTAEGYAGAAATLRAWMADGVLVRDVAPTLTLYRQHFTDETGAARSVIGVLGGLPVVDYRSSVEQAPDPSSCRRQDPVGSVAARPQSLGNSRDPAPGGITTAASTVLPHENVTPKASTDRLDLTRATNANLSPVWGLSLASGLAGLLQRTWDAAVAAGAVPAGLEEAGVTHETLPIADAGAIDAINALLGPADVLIADGHHRYGVAQKYRDEAGTPAARHTLAFVGELVDDQLSVEAIHRLYDGVSFHALCAALATSFDLAPAPRPTQSTLAEMVATGRLVLLAPDGSAAWLTPKPGAFDGVRALDGAWLEHALAGVPGLQVSYQHGLAEVLGAVSSHAGAVLIRPTSIAEIRRTATEGLLMPPKSTFFTPKLRTGLVLRTMDE